MALTSHALFRRLDEPAPDAAKAGCYIYGDRGPCVDTGVDVYMEGTLTLSVGAIKEMAEIAGFRVNEEGRDLEVRNAELERQVGDLQAEIAELLAELQAVGSVVRRAAE